MNRSDSVLEKSSVVVLLVLDDRAESQDSLVVLAIVGQRVTKELEGLVVLTQANIQQTYRGQQLRVLGVCIQTLRVDF